MSDTPDSPFWEPDQKHRSCQSCDSPFTAFRRHHHCRSCGNNICHECSAISKRKSRRCKCCGPVEMNIYVFRVRGPSSCGGSEKFVIPRSSRFEKQLGAGAEGKVILLQDARRPVALKKLPNAMCSRTSVKASEVVFQQHLQHPHIVEHAPEYSRVHGQDVYVGQEAMACDLMYVFNEGWVGELSAERISRWMEQLMSALAYLHSLDIVHRDVREDNLLLTEDLNTLKLGDFGIAKSVALMRTAEKAMWKADDLTKACQVRSRIYSKACLEMNRYEGRNLHDIYVLQAVPSPCVNMTETGCTEGLEMMTERKYTKYSNDYAKRLKIMINNDLEAASTREGLQCLLKHYRLQAVSRPKRRSGG